MIGSNTTITHISPDELDASRIPALARKGADIDNPAILYQTMSRPTSLEAVPWVLTLPCGNEHLLSGTATAQEYAMIGDATTLVVHMRTEYLPLALVHALQHLLSIGKTVWLVSHTAFTLTQRPLIYTLHRLCEMPASEWTYLSLEQFPSEGIARVFISPDGDPQMLEEDEACP
jgi:hypothetical protein